MTFYAAYIIIVSSFRKGQATMQIINRDSMIMDMMYMCSMCMRLHTSKELA